MAIRGLARMMELQVRGTNIGNTGKDSSNKGRNNGTTGKDSSNKGTNNGNTVVAAKAHDHRLHLGSHSLHAVSTGLPARTRERTLRTDRPWLRQCVCLAAISTCGCTSLRERQAERESEHVCAGECARRD